ncbi:hypothetical protein JFX23_06875 [Schaalia cardiffensis]|uniref:glutaredoxin domain-containing protein n=1 Tax=Schaalia cardiffensis TaxID=181487 RepID=UPI0018E880BB|nr:glutaredoxin domain-containing protein [Schaalia cardiffensis]MBJ2329485.1 hypothetical protein [Schaalia cardiffensis]
MLTPQTRLAPGNIDPNRDDWKGTIHEHYEQAGDAAWNRLGDYLYEHAPLPEGTDDDRTLAEALEALNAAGLSDQELVKILFDDPNATILPDAHTTDQARPVTYLQADQERQDDRADTLPAVTLYTTPGCPGCQMTHRAFEKAGLEFITIDLSTRPDLIEQFKREGLMSAPILEDEAGERTSGFRPDRIRALIAANTGKTTHASTARNASTAVTASTKGSAPSRPHGRSTFEAGGPRP